jgi:putative hemolysin
MSPHVRLTTLAVVAVLAACSSTHTPASQPSPASTPASTTATAASPSSELTAWCAVKIGDPQTTVTSKLGAPHGHRAASALAGFQLPSGTTYSEWDIGQDILLATFTNGTVTNLQAYDNAVGPNGATDLGCAAFRSS